MEDAAAVGSMGSRIRADRANSLLHPELCVTSGLYFHTYNVFFVFPFYCHIIYYESVDLDAVLSKSEFVLAD